MAKEAEDKTVFWMKAGFKTPPFGEAARQEAGTLLRLLQKGVSISLPQSRQMGCIGAHCHELRVDDKDCTWRIIYFLEPDAVVVLHWFSKKDQRTPKLVIDTCKKRLRLYKQAAHEN